MDIVVVVRLHTLCIKVTVGLDTVHLF